MDKLALLVDTLAHENHYDYGALDTVINHTIAHIDTTIEEFSNCPIVLRAEMTTLEQYCYNVVANCNAITSKLHRSQNVINTMVSVISDVPTYNPPKVVFNNPTIKLAINEIDSSVDTLTKIDAALIGIQYVANYANTYSSAVIATLCTDTDIHVAVKRVKDAMK
jgi:hypothetical protein